MSYSAKTKHTTLSRRHSSSGNSLDILNVHILSNMILSFHLIDTHVCVNSSINPIDQVLLNAYMSIRLTDPNMFKVDVLLLHILQNVHISIGLIDTYVHVDSFQIKART